MLSRFARSTAAVARAGRGFSASVAAQNARSPAQAAVIEEGWKYGAHNYKPLPVVLSRGSGVFMYDIDGNEYFDFLSAYSAVNQGHCHPRIVGALIDQVQTLPLTSRAFWSDQYSVFCRFMTETFGYDSVLAMNSGVEAGESAIKLIRRWAYRVKKVEPNKCKIIMMRDNFWGRTLAAVSSSSDPDTYTDFGPFTPGFELVQYNDVAALEAALQDPNVGGVYFEPIQGEAGVNVPDEGYLTKVRELCTKYNVLMCADEIQTGLCRTGKMMACDHENVRPDLLVLGKALSGGTMPISAVLADAHIMHTIGPGEHGSTFGGCPLSCRVAVESIKVLQDEKLAENSEKLGIWFRAELQSKLGHLPFVQTIRGKGLLNGLVVDKAFTEKVTAWQLCLNMRDVGVLAKQTHENIIRFAPPLVINQAQIEEATKRIVNVFLEAAKK